MNMNNKTIENNHIMNIKNNNIYTDTVNMIIDDVLMGKIKKIGNGEIKLINITDIVQKLIDNWYIMANDLKKYNTHAFTVYRGVSNMDDTDMINQPLPFSTCIEFDNALNWAYDGFIMKINIKVEDLYTFTGNTSEGREVVLAPCKLKKVSSYIQDEVIINQYEMC